MVGGQFNLFRFGHLGTLVDPGAQRGDLSCAQRVAFAIRWHRLVWVDARDQLDEVAVGALAGDEQRFAGIAAAADRRWRIESQFGLLFFGAVALVAVFGEDRFHLIVEIDFGVGA